MNDTLLAWISFATAIPVGRWVYRRKKNKALKYLKLIEKAEKNGHYTQAVGVDAALLSGDRESSNPELRSRSMIVFYEYKIHGKVYRKKLLFQNRGRALIEYPTSVTVYYDPHNAKKAICKEELADKTDVGKQILPTILTVIFVTAAVNSLLHALLG